MTFALESDLCRALVGAWPLHLANEGHIDVLREVRVGAVIPDQIVVRTTNVVPEVPLPRLTLFEGEVLAAFADGSSRRATSVASRLFARIDRVREVLERMERRNVVRKVSGGTYELSRASLPKHIELIAVEAKLLRWRDAIEQAIEYRRFANRVYVALPQRTIEDHLFPCLDCCESHGIGLLAVKADSAEVLLHPVVEAPFTAEWFWLVSRVNRLREAASGASVVPRTARTPRATNVGG